MAKKPVDNSRKAILARLRERIARGEAIGKSLA